MIYLDTHVVAWLFAGRTDLLPHVVRQRLEESELIISPMVGLELQYLFEIGRTSTPAQVVVGELARAVGLVVCAQSFDDVVRHAWDDAWTRDPFDRLILSQARLPGLPLATKDGAMLRQYDAAFWE